MTELFPLIVCAAFAFGACVGSFLNVVIHRLPRGMSVAKPARSFCPHCKNGIPWYRNVPLVSWVWLNGKCGDCGAPIAVRYLAVEAVTALLFAGLAVARFSDARTLVPGDVLALAVDFALAALLVAITVIDFRHAIIPDPLTVPWLPGIVVAVLLEPSILRGDALVAASGAGTSTAAAALAGVAVGAFPALLVDFLKRRREVVPEGEEPESALPDEDEEYSLAAETKELFVPLLLPVIVAAAASVLLLAGRSFGPGPSAAIASAAGAGFGMLFLYVVRLVFTVAFGREAMGLGDAKFLALAGAVLGAEGALLVFVLSCALGAVPAFWSLLGRLPVATTLLIGSAILPIVLLPTVGETIGEAAALAVLMPIPLVALVVFLRRLRRGDVELTAMPFGPFLAVAALVLLVAYEPIRAFLSDLAAPLAG